MVGMELSREYLRIYLSYRNVMVLKIEIQSTKSSFLPSIKTFGYFLTPIREFLDGAKYPCLKFGL